MLQSTVHVALRQCTFFFKGALIAHWYTDFSGDEKKPASAGNGVTGSRLAIASAQAVAPYRCFVFPARRCVSLGMQPPSKLRTG